MCSHHKEISLGFSTTRFQPGVHMCMIYRDETERRSIISKYIESGILANEKIGYFTDIMTPEELKKWFHDLSIEIPSDPNNKQVTIAAAKDVYCPKKKFVPKDMINVLRTYYDSSIKEGFTGARVTGETTWTLEKIPGVEHFIEYEASINTAVETHPVTVMCQYDVTKFTGAALFDILQVHPLMVVHGQIVKNPAYLHPDEFLKQYRMRT